MDTVTISRKEYKRLIGVKRIKGLKEATKFDFSKTARFIGMWKDRRDIESYSDKRVQDFMKEDRLKLKTRQKLEKL